MAITWDTQITVRDVGTKRVSVTATRTDDVDPSNPITVRVSDAIIDTAAQKQHVVDTLWALYQAQLTRDAAVSAIVDNLETSANAALLAMEP